MQSQTALPEIRKTVLINAPIEKVWEAVSTAEGIARWWMPNTFEPELGHKFIVHAGDFGDAPCQVTELEPPNRIGFVWSKDWHLTFALKKYNTITEFTLIHSGWDAEKVTPFGHPHPMVREIMDSGWEKIVKEKLPSIFAG